MYEVPVSYVLDKQAGEIWLFASLSFLCRCIYISLVVYFVWSNIINPSWECHKNCSSNSYMTLMW